MPSHGETLHHIISSLGPVQSWSNSSGMSSAHAQCFWGAGLLFSRSSKYRLLWNTWQHSRAGSPLPQPQTHPWLLTLLTMFPPSRDIKGLLAGQAGKSEGGLARMLCCWWCQTWVALETWAWWGTFVLSGLHITEILKQSQEQPSASLKSFHLCLLSHTCPRAGFDPTASIISSSFTFCLSY